MGVQARRLTTVLLAVGRLRVPLVYRQGARPLAFLLPPHRGLKMAAESGTPSKVIVLTGPTGVGKSRMAMDLCKQLGGEIVSVDSVQVYRRLDIGSNKPTAAEQEVPHHLLDVVEPNVEEPFTAGEFLRRAEAAMDDILSRGNVPVVVGGTSMYTQWLVKGKPDAPRSQPEVEERARQLLAPYRARGDWEGACAVLAERSPQRAERILDNDWYRLERALEVTMLTPGAEQSAFTGARRTMDKYEFRCFFLVGPREGLCRVIDQRCVEMLRAGLLEETAQLLVEGVLLPESPPGRAIGYRQTIQYLTSYVEQGQEASAFKSFLEEFATATRRYAKSQMVWYRAQPEFVWLRWDLTDISEARAALIEAFQEGKDQFVRRQSSDCQAHIKEQNLKEGKQMKRYMSTVAQGLDDLEDLVQRAEKCRALVARGHGTESGDGRKASPEPIHFRMKEADPRTHGFIINVVSLDRGLQVPFNGPSRVMSIPYSPAMDVRPPITLDEPVTETIMRDLRQVGSKLRVVLLPVENQEGVLKKLKDWDLWGPLLVCLTLSILLSATAPEAQGALVFAAVFFIVWFGAVVVTLNAQLLGGNISFFQSLCILGYCVFPLDIAATTSLIVGMFFHSVIVKSLLVAAGFFWSTRASVIFVGQVISPERKVLALYPVFIFYTFLAWMVVMSL